nr:hypothetical protein Q903MT_gene4582 [Picea sitchensis]
MSFRCVDLFHSFWLTESRGEGNTGKEFKARTRRSGGGRVFFNSWHRIMKVRRLLLLIGQTRTG